MAKLEALVLRDEKGNLYVMPSEYIETTKVDPKSHQKVMDQLTDSPEDVKLGGGFSINGVISLPDGADLARAEDDIAWPHYFSPKK